MEEERRDKRKGWEKEKKKEVTAGEGGVPVEVGHVEHGEENRGH